MEIVYMYIHAEFLYCLNWSNLGDMSSINVGPQSLVLSKHSDIIFQMTGLEVYDYFDSMTDAFGSEARYMSK